MQRSRCRDDRICSAGRTSDISIFPVPGAQRSCLYGTILCGMTYFFRRRLRQLLRGWLRRGRAAAPAADTPLSFIHRFEIGTDPSARPVLLLHGTGQDESALLPLGRLVAPTSPLLSPRGKISEDGQLRFFNRFAPGVLDEADVMLRAEELADFIVKACKYYRISAPIALGYSNGANMALAVMLLRSETIAGGDFLRPAMVPFSKVPHVDLRGKPILVISGTNDPTIVAEHFSELASLLRRLGDHVEFQTLPVGHELSRTDIALASAWYRERKNANRLPAA